jgi:hypothetical protein
MSMAATVDSLAASPTEHCWDVIAGMGTQVEVVTDPAVDPEIVWLQCHFDDLIPIDEDRPEAPVFLPLTRDQASRMVAALLGAMGKKLMAST